MAWLKKNMPNAWVWKISDRFRKGIPDLLIINNGRHIFIELKRKGEEPRPLQRYTMNELAEAGAEVYLIDDVSQMRALLPRKE